MQSRHRTCQITLERSDGASSTERKVGRAFERSLYRVRSPSAARSFSAPFPSQPQSPLPPGDIGASHLLNEPCGVKRG